MKKKIVHILNSSSYSGAENVVITIINNMKDKYDSVYVSREGPIKDTLKDNDILFTSIKKMSVKDITRVLKDLKPDIIHAHDYTASIICAFSGINIPIISHLHNNAPWIQSYHPFSFLFLLSSFRYNKILGVSSSIFEEYVFGNLIRKKTEVISNPIDTTLIQSKAQLEGDEVVSEYDLIFIGRFTPSKNISRFIRIVKEIVKKLPNIKVCMIGNGEDFKENVELIKDSGLTENFTLTGFMDNPYKILSKSKVLCLTSKWEGFGLVAIEALSLGVPVVATQVGGIPDIVDERCGKLCITDQEFIIEIIKLLLDEEYLKVKSSGAFQRAKELNNIDGYMKMLDSLYSNI